MNSDYSPNLSVQLGKNGGSFGVLRKNRRFHAVAGGKVMEVLAFCAKIVDFMR